MLERLLSTAEAKKCEERNSIYNVRDEVLNQSSKPTRHAGSRTRLSRATTCRPHKVRHLPAASEISEIQPRQGWDKLGNNNLFHMAPRSVVEDAQINIFEDLSGINRPSSSNPYETLIQASSGDPVSTISRGSLRRA